MRNYIPQVILLALINGHIFFTIVMDGKPIGGNYSLGATVFVYLLALSLLTWGGFFR